MMVILGKRFLYLLVILTLIFFSNAFAQEQDTTTSSTDASSEETSSVNEDDKVLTGEGSEFLLLSEVALGVGWPGYQLINLNFGLQKDAFGVNFRGSWTDLGPYLSLQGRYYTPIPIPVPTFVSLGAGYYSGSPTGLATIGAQIPFGLSSPFRATIEAGVSMASGINGNLEFLPSASLSIGYTFFIDTTPLTEEELRKRELEASRPVGCEPTAPDSSNLSSLFNNKIDSELARAKVRYAGIYSLQGYSKTITDRETNEAGDRITWRGTWEATVKEVLTGKTTTGGGKFSVDFSWNGCGWSVSYSL